MTPPHVQMHVSVLVSAGWPAISTVGSPGAHGAVMAGTQGWGVRTPSAAAVAAATIGLAGLVHIANGSMFTIGTSSTVAAAGCVLAITRPVGSTVSADGARPNEHVSIAPLQT